MPTIEEICYLAGLIDGEGCIVASIHKTHKTRKRYGPGFIQIRIAMTDENTIRWIRDRFGGGSCNRIRPEKDWKNLYGVVWSGADAKALLKLVLPYFITKKKHAELALEWPMPLLKGPVQIPYWAEKKRESIYHELRELNKRGVSGSLHPRQIE